ncbi:PAS domain S-box protein [Rhodovulum tesquicola]|uniref:methyl-accepting chemotaxis protein n=1 Tax=Rhodovulum tesquicola TaxID=540254 RepID=UPI0020976833|nr:PAS domain-containing methyl-accepting chemotaxis protein [Rhodovulum tesquicola]MCO8146302.1 PAS domain S-box protein [Rhodovulum tesquicola]
MFFRAKKTASVADEAHVAAAFMSVIDRTQATIQFEPDGTIQTANENFLKTLGYSLSEVAGRHHSMFVDRTHAQTEDYRRFWQELASGKSFTDQFPRVRKDGSVIWIQATYAPYLDAEGKVRKVIKIATDITERQRGIEGIAEGLRELSNGDLMHRVPSCNAPDIDALGNAFNAAVDQLSTSISAVKEVSSAVERTADEVGQSSADLSQRTESQAATLEQTAAAIEELTSTVRAAADGAREVEASANDAKSTAENGGKVVGEAIDAMSRIEKSSTKISQIISKRRWTATRFSG